MRRILVLALLAVLAPAAHAGELHVAKAKLVGTSVQIEASFELDVDGPVAAPGESHALQLPMGAVITAATVRARGTHRLQLLRRADADKRLRVLESEPSAAGDRMSAVRIDADGDVATLEIAVPQPTRVHLVLSLEVPAWFEDDARHITVPTEWLGKITGGRAVGDDRIAFAVTTLARRRAGEQRVGMRSARLPLGDHDVARIEIALAKQLSEIPKDLHTVLVVDHSRSVTPDELATQRAVIAAYLRAVPDSRVQLVGYARDERTLLPGWMHASQAGTRIDGELRALSPRNGSNVERGIAAALTLLRDVRGTRRMIVFTDERLADRITNDVGSLAASLPRGILVHVVTLNGRGQRLARADGSTLEPLATATEGVAMSAGLDDQGAIDALPLARPVTFDNVTITSPGWTPLTDERECIGDDQFREGASCAWLGQGTPRSQPIAIEGWLWGKKIVRELDPDARHARTLARYLSDYTSMPDELLDRVREAAQAVNAAFSLVATWGPRGGYADIEGWGTIGLGGFGTSSHTIGHSVRSRPPQEVPIQELVAQLGPGVRTCRPQERVHAVVELTSEEIVDVSVTVDPRDAALVECIETAIWNTSLVLAAPPRHVTAHVELPPF